jgi:aryl-alcohol dehydrogenase-like predicted oxidoreductase
VRFRTLGSTGIKVSEIGFGAWGIGGDHGVPAYGPTDDKESLRALDAALKGGINFFDTSNLYGNGHSEKLLGEAFAGQRDRVVLSTKAGFTGAGDQQDFSGLAIRASVESSLRRLRTDHVDVLLLHNPAPERLRENNELWATLDLLKCEGRIRCFGISLRSPDEARAFVLQYPLSCIQVNFNLTDMRALENGLFDLCRERAVGIIVRTPLAFGFLTGKVDIPDKFPNSDHRSRFPPEILKRWNHAAGLYDRIFQMSAQATRAQNALRFCLSYDAVTTVIPGMLEAAQVLENLAALRADPLKPEMLRLIEEVYRLHFRDFKVAAATVAETRQDRDGAA